MFVSRQVIRALNELLQSIEQSMETLDPIMKERIAVLKTFSKTASKAYSKEKIKNQQGRHTLH